jgi:hypothetical protein
MCNVWVRHVVFAGLHYFKDTAPQSEGDMANEHPWCFLVWGIIVPSILQLNVMVVLWMVRRSNKSPMTLESKEVMV